MNASTIPVFHIAVGSMVFLAAAGLAIAAVPSLRRRRALVRTWILIVIALSIAVLVNLVRLLLEFT